MSADAPDGYFTINEAAERLSISRSLMRKLLVMHKPTVLRLGGRRVFIPAKSLDELIRLSTVQFTPHGQIDGRQTARYGRPRKQ
jgi:excisionase family DNA binding protein